MKKVLSTKKRRNAIKELIKTDKVRDQQTLVQLMRERYGIDTNQAVVSRDLRALGVSKHQVRGKMVYELKEVDASREILRLAIVEVMHNDTMIVIKTLPGLAAFVADYLDMQEDSGILATLAGENALFIAPQNTNKTAELFKTVCTLVHVKTETSGSK